MAVVKISCEMVGMSQLLHDWGYEVDGQVFVDSSAALGIVKRKGNGKMRHVRVGMLWIQEAAEEGHLEYKKVLGTLNPADLMTKALSWAVIERHLEYIGHEIAKGVAQTGLSAACSLKNVGKISEKDPGKDVEKMVQKTRAAADL